MNAQTNPGLAPAPALILGAGGLVPFVCLPILSASHPASELLLQALATYAAVILSFVGALHWGYALQTNSQGRMAFLQYGWSVLPALVGWLALQLPLVLTLRTQALTFIACYAVDHVLAAAGKTPRWFLQMRAWLSAIACAALLGASFV